MVKKKSKKAVPRGVVDRKRARNDAERVKGTFADDDAVTASYEVKPPAAPTQARAIADLSDRTHDARAPRASGPVAPVPGRPGAYVQDFGTLDSIIAREARKRCARDDREGVH